jgi:hypothetical protein
VVVNRPPPRPSRQRLPSSSDSEDSRQIRQRLPSYPDDPQPTLFDEWARDRADGITLRGTRKLLDEHLHEYSNLLARVVALETNEKRNAEDRQWSAAAGTGRFIVAPPDSRFAVAVPPAPALPSASMRPPVTQRAKPMKPWYAQDPFLKPLRYILIGLAVLALREIYTRLGLPAPH